MAPVTSEELQAKAREKAADPKRGADVFRPPTAVEAWYAQLDKAGREAAANASWWQAFLNEQCGEGGDWVRNWPPHAKHVHLTDHQHRETAPLHYVMGRISPFYIERAFSKDRSRAVWAVYLGPYSSNGDTQLGVGNGGAIAAVLDLMTANLGSLYTQGATPTASLAVKMLKPAVPMPGLFKAEAWVDREEKGKLYLKAEFSNGEGKVFDTCEAVLGIAKSKPASKL